MATTAPADRPLHLAGERLPFAMLPRWLLYHPGVNEGAKFLYCVLHDLVQGREGPTRPVTRAQLAAACGVSADTIDRRLAQLVGVGAVEKEHQIRAGGQQANIYRVWLTPPDGLHRTAPGAVDNRSRNRAAPVESGANGLVERSRESAAPPPQPHGCATGDRTGAAPDREEEKNQELPPQPPRPAGGHDGMRGTTGPPHGPPPGATDDATSAPAGETPASGEPSRVGSRQSVPGPRRQARTNPRALGTHPRADAEFAEAARVEAEVAARQAELEARTQARRDAEQQAELEAERLEAEALAVSAGLADPVLARIVDAVTGRMPGPLARSPLAIARAVVAWCRAAVTEHPGPLAEAAAAALASDLVVGEGHPQAGLDLPPAPGDTPLLRHRIAALVRPGAAGDR